MDVTKAIAKLRLKYHLNMIDVCNVANQLSLLSDERANMANKNHFKECLDCYERLGYKLPQIFRDFKNES